MFDPPDWAARAALGFTKADFGDDDTVYVWPDNWRAFEVFAAMRNQWRSGVAGYYGLDMNVFDLFCQRLGVPPEEQDDVFQCVLVMEQAALQFFDGKRKAKG